MSDRFLEELALCFKVGYPLVFVLSQEEERALQLIEQAAAAAGKSTVCLRAPGAAPVTTGLMERVVPGQLALIDALHRHLDDPRIIRELADFAGAGGTAERQAVIVAPWIELPPELERLSVVLDLPLPSSEDLGFVLKRVCGETGVSISEDDQLELVRVAQGLSREEAMRSFRKGLIAHPEESAAARESVAADKKITLRRTRVLENVDTPGTLDDVGGLDLLKTWLYSRREAFTLRAREFGLPAPRGLLLMGVQGCGKSLSAKAVAGFWQLPLVRLDLAAVFGNDRPEEALRGSLKVAEAMSPCVLWIDEIEKGFESGGGGTAARLLGGMVTWLQEKQAEVFVVATANRVAGLPPELPRKGRFDDIFFVDLPNEQERMEIFGLHLKRRGRNPDDYPVEQLAQKAARFSGSEIEQVIIAAMYTAFARGDELKDRDLLQTIKDTVPLYETYEEEIKRLREWARKRARPASTDRRKADLFAGGGSR